MSRWFINYIYICTVILILLCDITNCSFLDYLPFGNSWFGQRIENEQIEHIQKVPYEVSLTDNKFIEQAAKYTGVALSELDKCQHRVVLKLHQDCHKLNDEELAKLAVKLLNCQSAIEGRQIFPCTDAMPIRDCTSNMDSDTWNSYLLMSNRARAVCYSIRQAQFRGLTEITVNKLMGAAHEQLDIMSRIKDGQFRLEQATSETLESVVHGNEALKKQQDDLRQAQFHGQLVLEDNIRRLADEKQLILDGHEKLALMTSDVKEKLDEATQQMNSQADEQKENHMQILNDLVLIQQQVEIILARIEKSSKRMLEQSSLAAKQYDATFAQLEQMNSTVHSLVEIISATRSTLEEKLNWLAEALGGTDNAVERLYLFLTHITYLILAMITSAFLQIHVASRLALFVFVPINLLVALQQGTNEAFSIFGMTIVLTSFVAVQTLIVALTHWRQRKREVLKNIKNSSNEKTNTNNVYERVKNLSNGTVNGISSTENEVSCKNDYIYQNDEFSIDERDEVTEDVFQSPTPPLSRYGLSRSRSSTPQLLHLGTEKRKCNAKTRVGKPCTLTAQTGREYCFRHQTGSSVILS